MLNEKRIEGCFSIIYFASLCRGDISIRIINS